MILLLLAGCSKPVPPEPEPKATALFVVASDNAVVQSVATETAALFASLAPEAGVSLLAGETLAERLGEEPVAAVVACGADLPCIAALGERARAREVLLMRCKQRPDEVVVSQFLTIAVETAKITRRGQIELPTDAELERQLRANAEQILGTALPPPPEPAARCDVVEGIVRVQRRGGEWRPLHAGEGLEVGDRVETGPGGVARILYAAGAIINLNPRSKVVIGEASGEDNRVTLHAGTLRGEMGENSGRVVVMAPDGEEIRVAPQGGSGKLAYRVGMRDDDTVEVAVSEGSAAVTTGRGDTATLKAGRAQDVQGGALAGEAVELPDFPQLFFPGVDATVMFHDALEIAMKWKDVGPERQYHVQVAEDQSFNRLLLDEVVAAPAQAFEPPRPVTVYWRVATRDSLGREGEFGFARRLYVTPEKIPDLLVTPADGAIFEFEAFEPRFVTFAWRAAVPPAPYALVFGRGENIQRTKVLEIVTTAQRLNTRQLKPGTYYWGVFVKRKSGRKPIFLRPRKVTLVQ